VNVKLLQLATRVGGFSLKEVREQVLGKLECWPVLRFSIRFRVTGLAGSNFWFHDLVSKFSTVRRVRYISI